MNTESILYLLFLYLFPFWVVLNNPNKHLPILRSPAALVDLYR